MTEFQVIDADGHLTDKDNAIAPYLDKPFRSRRRPFHIQDNWDRAMGGRLGASAPDPETWIKAMDKEGIDVAVLYPTAALGIGAVRKPDFAAALCRAYNDFVYDPYVIDRMGENVLLYASDFPHWDSGYPYTVKIVVERQDISEGQKKKCLAGNARRFYNLAGPV